MEEDHTRRTEDAESRELIVSGTGDVHIDVIVDRLKPVWSRSPDGYT